MIIRFKIGGSLRFLSHAETLRLLQRACVRAGMNIRYSQGFNPHPRMSLPLPRPVGVESDCELLAVQVYKSIGAQGQKSSGAQEQKGTGAEEDKSSGNSFDLCAYDLCTYIQNSLSAQLPDGFELISVDFAGPKDSFVPCSATYEFSLLPELLDGRLQNRVNNLMASENLYVRRTDGKAKSKSGDIDVRCFLSSIEFEGADIIVECSVTPTGSIRVKEVLELLELDEAMLASPVRRTNVQWRDV